MSRLLIRALRRELMAVVAVAAAMSLSVGFASGSTTDFESSAAPAHAEAPSADRPPCGTPGRADGNNPRCDDGEPTEEEPGGEEPGGEESAEEEPGAEGSCATGGAADGGATWGEQLGGSGLDEDGPVSGPIHEQAEPEAGEAGPVLHELACGGAALEGQMPGEEQRVEEPGEAETGEAETGEEEPGEDGAGDGEAVEEQPGEEKPAEEDGCATAPDEDGPVPGATRELACDVTKLEVRVPAGLTIR
jgi:hypothetical protein